MYKISFCFSLVFLGCYAFTQEHYIRDIITSSSPSSNSIRSSSDGTNGSEFVVTEGTKEAPSAESTVPKEAKMSSSAGMSSRLQNRDQIVVPFWLGSSSTGGGTEPIEVRSRFEGCVLGSKDLRFSLGLAGVPVTLRLGSVTFFSGWYIITSLYCKWRRQQLLTCTDEKLTRLLSRDLLQSTHKPRQTYLFMLTASFWFSLFSATNVLLCIVGLLGTDCLLCARSIVLAGTGNKRKKKHRHINYAVFSLFDLFASRFLFFIWSAKALYSSAKVSFLLLGTSFTTVGCATGGVGAEVQ